MIAHIAALRWRIIRHGPHDERGFSLVAGGIVAASVVVLAQRAASGSVDPGWVVVALTAFGLTWLLGPILLPGAAATVDPQWFRTLPRRPWRVACAMAPSEAMSVGTVITAIALCGIVVLAAPHGGAVTGVAVAAALAQLFFLLWMGRFAAAIVGLLLRSAVGVWAAAVQMSLLLAVSFAGWVPIAALLLPDFAEGETEVLAPSASTFASVPSQVVDVMFALPTGWGPAAVSAAAESAPLSAILVPVLGLLLGGAALCAAWVVLTSRALRTPPARARSSITVRADRPPRWAPLAGAARALAAEATEAVTVRELKTWLRDPQRSLELRHAWLTPLLMIVVIVPTNWSWTLPFVGVMAAVIAAMVAVNTYALDGTALWQVLTTPQAIRADVHGRQLAWMLLFGFPIIVGSALLAAATLSPFWDIALGATLAAVGAGCGAAPLLAVVMPAIGTDARERVSTGHNVGNAAGGQFTVFGLVAGVAVLPGILVHQIGGDWAVHLIVGLACGGAAFLLFGRLTQLRLRRSGPSLLAALTSGDSRRAQRQT